MKVVWNHLADPSLHLLTIASVLLYLAFGGGSWQSRNASDDRPLPYCQTCQSHFIPEKPCACALPGRIASLTP